MSHVILSIPEYRRANMEYGTDTMEALLNRFNSVYNFLYDADCSGAYVAGSREAMEYGDLLIDMNHPVVGAFADYRRDFLSSDREVTAFGFAVTDLGIA